MLTNCRENNWSSPSLLSSTGSRWRETKNTSILHVTDRYRTPSQQVLLRHLNNLCYCCFTAEPYQQFSAAAASRCAVLVGLSDYDKLYVTVVFAAVNADSI